MPGSHLHGFFKPDLHGSLLVVLQVSASIIADQFAAAVEVKDHQSGNAIDAIALFQVLDPLLIDVGYGCEWHGCIVALEGCLVAIVATENDLHTLPLVVDLLIELRQRWGKKATGRCPVCTKVDADQVWFSVDLHQLLDGQGLLA